MHWPDPDPLPAIHGYQTYLLSPISYLHISISLSPPLYLVSISCSWFCEISRYSALRSCTLLIYSPGDKIAEIAWRMKVLVRSHSPQCIELGTGWRWCPITKHSLRCKLYGLLNVKRNRYLPFTGFGFLTWTKRHLEVIRIYCL